MLSKWRRRRRCQRFERLDEKRQRDAIRYRMVLEREGYMRWARLFHQRLVYWGPVALLNLELGHHGRGAREDQKAEAEKS